MKFKKPTFRHIESELFSYNDTLKEIQALRNEIMFTKENADENIGGGRSSLPSSPTENAAVKLAANKRLNNLEEIARAIEEVYNISNSEYKNLIRLKYWTRPQTKTWEGIAAELHISRRQALRWRDQIIQAIAEVLGWR